MFTPQLSEAWRGTAADMTCSQVFDTNLKLLSGQFPAATLKRAAFYKSTNERMKSFSPNTDNIFKSTEDRHIAHGPTVCLHRSRVRERGSAEASDSLSWCG